MTNREEYFPFGETSFGSYASKRYRFCGKERDEESGLSYYGARYYAPWSCRFVSIDPLAEKYAFMTPYQYAGNKPIVGIDIDGLENTNGTSLAESLAQSDHSDVYRNQNDVVNTNITATVNRQQIEVAKGGAKANFEKANQNLGFPAYQKAAPVRDAASGRAEGNAKFAESLKSFLIQASPIGMLATAGSAAIDAAGGDWEAAKGLASSRLGTTPVGGILHGYNFVHTLATGDAHDVSEAVTIEGDNLLLNAFTCGFGGEGGAAVEGVSEGGAGVKQLGLEPAIVNPALAESASTFPKLSPYKTAGGHHPLSQAAWKGYEGYNGKDALSLSQGAMKELGIQHSLVTKSQRILYTELIQSGGELTFETMASIEKQAFIDGGSSVEMAEYWVESAIVDLKVNQGITTPFRIPYLR